MFKRTHVFLLAILAFCLIGPAAFLPSLHATALTVSAERPTAPVSWTAAKWAALSLSLGMAIKVKDSATAAKKFKDRASAASGDYSAGVQASAGEWEGKAAAAEELYKSAVMDAASKGAYGKGVRGSGQKYLKNATTLGPQRYQQGIGNAQDAYAQAMGPVLSTIAGLTLPPRGVKGTNQERSNVVATALRKAKVGA